MGKKIKIRFVQDSYWDNWGTIVRVFNFGDEVDAIEYDNGDVVAESTIYNGVSDFVNPRHFVKIENGN